MIYIILTNMIAAFCNSFFTNIKDNAKADENHFIYIY